MGGFSAAQLAEHYTNCMKLSAENKISIKNAFQLKLIDTMSEMIRKKAKDMDNFQVGRKCSLPVEQSGLLDFHSVFKTIWKH